MLEKLLGYSPPPPPPDVPLIEPDIRGAVSIRDQLLKHRNVATCAECHRKIDPLGFALENYDAIGGWRDEYDGKVSIDSSGKLPDGDSFETPAEFQDALMRRKDQFTRCITEKLLAYALGRELEVSDRPVIDEIVQEISSPGKGLRDLIQEIVASRSFLEN